VRWTVPLALAATVGAVLAATLASPNKASADVVIAGARSISDPGSIAYGVKKQGTTTDVHVLAFNDLHGNLEAAGNNIYGHFAGGAAYLAKAIKDRQAQYGGRRRPSSQATTSVPARLRTGSSSRSRSPSRAT
jgi:hypothetical protein